MYDNPRPGHILELQSSPYELIMCKSVLDKNSDPVHLVRFIFFCTFASLTNNIT